MHKVTATPEQEQHVRQSVLWNDRWFQRLGGELYFHEELAGPDGMNVQLFVTEDTSELIIQAAEQQAYEEGDVVSIHALIVPEEWLEGVKATGPNADIHTLRQIVETHTANTLRWSNGEKQLVDVTTADLLIKVFENLKEPTRSRVEGLVGRSKADFLNVVDTAWGCVK